MDVWNNEANKINPASVAYIPVLFNVMVERKTEFQFEILTAWPEWMSIQKTREWY